jgi:hypothetical protein
MLASNTSKVVLTAAQQDWVDIQRVVSTTRAMPLKVRPQQRLRARVFDLVNSPAFTWCSVVLVLANAVVLAVVYPGIPAAADNALHLVNVVISCLFVLEMGLRVLGQGWTAFYKVRGRCQLPDVPVLLPALLTVLSRALPPVLRLNC